MRPPLEVESSARPKRMKDRAKTVVKSLPYLRPVFEERDSLRVALAAARAEAATLGAAADELRRAGDELRAAAHGLRAERNAAAVERDVLKAELDAARGERDAARSERDAARVELEALRAERDALKGGRISAEAERDLLVSERDALLSERDELRRELARQKTWVPPGHFYSPIPAPEEILAKEHEIWRQPKPVREIPGVDLREEEQLKLLGEFAAYHREQPFAATKQERLRYFFENDQYSYSDALAFYCVLRRLRPRRLVEIGSGFSSCVALDTDELFLGGTLSCTFVEPNPARLFSLLKKGDRERIEVVTRKVQDVDPSLFRELGAGDVLFVDSTHVAKTLSDVNHIFFHVLPSLRPGVLVQFHDIFYPFVYPKDWELEGRAWNETYLLRAFLQYNRSFRIYFWNTFMEFFHEDRVRRELPLSMKCTGGSIWLEKL